MHRLVFVSGAVLKKLRVLFLLLMLASVMIPAKLFAAPFAKYFDFSQPDKTKIRLWGEGDEFQAVFETTDGYTVVFNPQAKAYFYARRSDDGKELHSTGIMAHHAVPGGLKKHQRIDKDVAKAKAIAKRKKWDADTQLTERWTSLKAQNLSEQTLSNDPGIQLAPPSSPTTGTKIGLTLLIDFADDPATISQSEIDAFLNGDSYTGYSNNGSVKKYFSDVSNGRLTYTNVVTLYVRMTQPKSYYNNTSIESGTQGRLLISDALAILKARGDYDSTILPTFNSLTVDGSSRVVALNVFFAGGHSGVWSYGLWPHAWSLASSIPLGNGKSVYRYQVTNIGSSLAIGTFSHENGHMLCGFPDLYDYGYDSVGGAGQFSLMGSGGNGTNPSQVDAYLKLAAGWATVTDITNATNITGALWAAPNPGYDQFYRYRKPGVATEYFLFENRHKSGRDANLPASGIAVWHVDELGKRDNQSLTPNDDHNNYELTLVQADNLWHFETTTNNSGDVNDLYYLNNSASAYTNTLTDASSPNAHWWDGSSSGMNANSFSASGSYMTFKFGTGTPLPVPVLGAEPAITAGSANTVTWGAVTAMADDSLPAVVQTASPPAPPNFESGVSPGANAVTTPIELAGPGPNLTPYKPSGWSDKIVVSSTTGTSTDSSTLYPTDTLYVDWAVINNGDTATAATFYTELYVDNVLRKTWYMPPPLNANYYTGVQDVSIGTLATGTHTIRIKTDSTGAIAESSESDNEYTKTITIGGPIPNLTPSQPIGWSDKIVVSNGSGTTIDSYRLSTTDTLYVDWAVGNNGGAGTAARFYTELYVDNVLKNSWYSDPPLGSNAYTTVLDYSLGTLAAGTHTIKVKTDTTGAITESNEGDNEYTKTITVVALEYYAECADNSGFSSPVTSGWTPQTQWTFSGLAAGQTYWYRVKSRRGTEESGWSNIEYSLQASPPAAPTVTSVKAGNGKATVYLSPGATGGSPITGYTVTTSVGTTPPTMTLPIVISGLTNGTSYSVTANAVNAIGTSPDSAPFDSTVTPGLVRNYGYDVTGYATLQAAYDADTPTTEFQVVGGALVGGLLKDNDSEVTIKGGYDADFMDSDGAASVLGKVELRDGLTMFQNVVIRP